MFLKFSLTHTLICKKHIDHQMYHKKQSNCIEGNQIINSEKINCFSGIFNIRKLLILRYEGMIRANLNLGRLKGPQKNTLTGNCLVLIAHN